NLDGRRAAASRKIVEGHCRIRVRNAIEWSPDGFDSLRESQIECPHRNIDQVRAHVAKRAVTPIDPTTPIEGMIDRVIFDIWRGAKEQVPGERSRNRIIPGERVCQSRVDSGAVPGKLFGRRLERFRPWNPLRPVAERPVRPDM